MYGILYTSIESNIFWNNDSTLDVIRRVQLASVIYAGFRTIWKDKDITVDIKLNLLTTCVFSVLYMLLLRGQLKEKMKEDFRLFDMRRYGNLLNIRWLQKVTNDSIRQQLNKQKTIINTIRHKKKLTLFEHVCRMPNNRAIDY